MPARGPSADQDVHGNEYVQSLDRGLAVIRCFGADAPLLTTSEVARATGLTRGTARRFLGTLERLGYLGQTDGRYFVRPRVLELGYAAASALSLAEIVGHPLDELAALVGESCAASSFDGHEVTLIARAQADRIMRISLPVGNRVPPYVSSMGRVHLAWSTPRVLDEYLASARFEALTERTTVDPDELRDAVAQVRELGYSVVDEEMEWGVRAIAVPVRDGDGNVVTAIAAIAHASRVQAPTLVTDFLPALLRAAKEIEGDLQTRDFVSLVPI